MWSAVRMTMTSTANCATAPRYMSRTALSTVRGERDNPIRIRIAPLIRSADSTRLGRRWPSRAVASSTVRISSWLSFLKDRG
jgi:hypothetical protein